MPTVTIGTTVTITDEASGAESQFSIVRPGDGKPAQGTLAEDSPVGKALANHSVGEVVDVRLPSGKNRSLRILAIA